MSKIDFNTEVCAEVIKYVKEAVGYLDEAASSIKTFYDSCPTDYAIYRAIDKLSEEKDEETGRVSVVYETQRWYHDHYGSPLKQARNNLSTIRGSISELNTAVSDVDTRLNTAMNYIDDFEIGTPYVPNNYNNTPESLDVPPEVPVDPSEFGNENSTESSLIDDVTNPDVDTTGDGQGDSTEDNPGEGIGNIDVDTDGDGIADTNIDVDGDGIADINIDTNGDGVADTNIDINGDGIADLNIDTNGDGVADTNIDINGDGIADLNIDINGDGKPDLNIDVNGDGIADLNIDTNGDGIADLNIDTNGDGIADLNVDTNGDGKPDLNIDTNGDGTPDANIDTNNDGVADQNLMIYDVSTGGWINPILGLDGMNNFDSPDTGLSGYDIPGGPTDKYAANPFGLNFGDDSLVSSGVAIAGMVGLGAAAANAASTLTDKAKFSEGERDYDDDAKMSPEEYKKKKIKTIISCVLLGILLVGNLIALIIPSTTSLSILLLGVAIAITAIITSMGIKFGKLFTLCATLANVLIIFIISCFGVIPVFGYFIAFVIVSAVFLYYYFKDIFAKVLPRFDFVPAVVALVVIGFVGFFTLIGFLVWWLAIILVILTITGYFVYNYYGFAEKEAEREKQGNISFMDYIESISKSSKSNDKDTKNKVGNNKTINTNNRTGAIPGKTNKYVNDSVNKPMDGAPRVTEIDKFIAKLNGEEIKEETQEDVIRKHTSQNKINNNVADLFGNGNNFNKKSNKPDMELPKTNNNNNKSGKNKFFN